ncbi:hypothetical protein CTA1_3084 [Colletotrichum tanaceti]|uniref:Uncharacterized protein n=1 Tax=Colletotrichum tanaceti TaxID=1306861 RepID=A0A4V6DHU0_9PEZI|nr:hypothetical protein CTA1_3084 [Colletotrichum tanaceti]
MSTAPCCGLVSRRLFTLVPVPVPALVLVLVLVLVRDTDTGTGTGQAFGLSMWRLPRRDASSSLKEPRLVPVQRPDHRDLGIRVLIRVSTVESRPLPTDTCRGRRHGSGLVFPALAPELPLADLKDITPSTPMIVSPLFWVMEPQLTVPKTSFRSRERLDRGPGMPRPGAPAMSSQVPIVAGGSRPMRE